MDQQLHRTAELDVSAEDLWQMISDPVRMAEWLGDSVDVDVRPGGTGAIVDDGLAKHVHVDTVDAGRRVSFTWWEPGEPQQASRVTLEITTDQNGLTRLHITEAMPMPDRNQARSSARTEMSDRHSRWEARVCLLWACTVVAALVA